MNNLPNNQYPSAYLKKRYRFDFLFKSFCISIIALLFILIIFLFGALISNASSALKRTEIEAKIYLNSEAIRSSNYNQIYDLALHHILPNSDIAILKSVISDSAILNIIRIVKKSPKISNDAYIKIKLPFNSLVDEYLKDNSKSTNLKKSQIYLLDQLKKENLIEFNFNYNILTYHDSRYPEEAGLKTALIGSLFTILICICASFPIALITSIYLEEFAPKNKFISLIELNISNLASVPSIVFGLVGLLIYIEFCEFPRSSSIVAGLTLSLIVLPIMIFNFRQAIKSIPKSLKENVLALGISKMQLVLHHILPLTFPAIINGIILAITRAIGETAPLILIGMVAFIINTPKNIYSPTTVMPTQIYLWANSPEIAFKNKVSVAILLLVIILILLNIFVIFIRKKYEKKF